MVNIYNEDYLSAVKNIPDNSIDLIVTDPPYTGTPHGTSGLHGNFNTKLYEKGTVFEHCNIDIAECAKELYRISKDTTHCYVMTTNLHLIEYYNAFSGAGFTFCKNLIWHKNNKIATQQYMNSYEYIMFFRKGSHKCINKPSTPDVLQVTNVRNRLHPTEKPVDLMKILIENSSNKGDTVLDPFMGVGSTGIACLQLQRNFVGMEIDPKYFNIAKERLNTTTPYNTLWN